MHGRNEHLNDNFWLILEPVANALQRGTMASDEPR